jgi:hypothetical protein
MSLIANSIPIYKYILQYLVSDLYNQDSYNTTDFKDRTDINKQQTFKNSMS